MGKSTPRGSLGHHSRKGNSYLSSVLRRKSVFLFGPRQTGKTTYLRQVFPDAAYYSLHQSDSLVTFSKEPSRLKREIEALKAKNRIVIIDEIQKLPLLLDEIHGIIGDGKTRFVLTGSSARKLRRSGTNLLGGRASQIHFHPFNYAELGNRFNLERALQYGTLPPVWLSAEPWSELKDYVDLYLREEIMAEGLTRNLPAFSRFLETAALCNGQMINYTEIGNDAQVSKTTTYEYFQVLKDTLIAHEVPAFRKTKNRKAISAGKFYFFDNGVVRYLQGRDRLTRHDADFGNAFESYMFHELRNYTDFNRLSDIMYWRSTSGFEVDFIIDGRVAVEVKSTRRIDSSDLKGLRALKEEKMMKKYILVSLDKSRQAWDGVDCVYYDDFLKALWQGEIV